MPQSDDRTPCERAIAEAVQAARQALAHLTVEDKLIAIEQLRGWIAMEEATFLPEVQTRN
jgi:hypothetical protein